MYVAAAPQRSALRAYGTAPASASATSSQNIAGFKCEWDGDIGIASELRGCGVSVGGAMCRTITHASRHTQVSASLAKIIQHYT